MQHPSLLAGSGVVAVALLAAQLAGCAGRGAEQVPLASMPVELSATAFFPQRDFMCGPAALATVLDASGVDAHPDLLAPSLYIPGRRGTLQVELLAAARRYGRLAVELDGTLEAIVGQLQAGRPVLVLQNLAARIVPVWHYAVVVGYRPEDDRLVLRSGRERRALVPRRRFEATWSRAENWALVVLDTESPPTGLAPGAYLNAAAALENTGAYALALSAFRSAAIAWPDQPTALLGQANNLYYLGRYGEAERVYRQLIAAHPHQVVAIHNLSLMLLEADRPCEAAAVVRAAPGLEDALLETARRAVADAGDC